MKTIFIKVNSFIKLIVDLKTDLVIIKSNFYTNYLIISYLENNIHMQLLLTWLVQHHPTCDLFS